MQPATPLRLLLNEFPISSPALCILFCLRGVIERELDVMEGREFFVVQQSHTVTVGSDGEFHRFCLQVGQYRLELGMHAVLTRAKIHRSHGQTFHHCLHLIKRKTIRASRIAVAERARKITFVGEAEPERNTGTGYLHGRSGPRWQESDVDHPRPYDWPVRCAMQCV